MILWFFLVDRLEVGRGPRHSGSIHRLLPSETCIWQTLRGPKQDVDSHSTVNRRQVSLPPHLARMMWPFYWMVSDSIRSSQWAVQGLDMKIRLVVGVRNQNRHQHGRTKKDNDADIDHCLRRHIPHVGWSSIIFQVDHHVPIFRQQVPQEVTVYHDTITATQLEVIITMSTHAHHSPGVVLPVNGDNLDVLIEDIMIGFQTSPTESPISPAGRIFFFYTC